MPLTRGRRPGNDGNDRPRQFSRVAPGMAMNASLAFDEDAPGHVARAHRHRASVFDTTNEETVCPAAADGAAGRAVAPFAEL